MSMETLRTALAQSYRIERELGAGGMATVYLAHDLKHDRLVAVKVLKPELGAVLGAERFLAEIKVTAHLQHPNLLPLFDSGTAGGLLYYVMPYIEGETLRSRLNAEQQLPVDDTIRLVTLIAAALDYAHGHGVVHRDLKPENILLQAGQPVVADFGIALAVAQAGGGRITQTGLSLGTPNYMSPEQASGERAVDARSDQYALGALSYEMLTGEPPHTGATAQVIIARLMTETPRSVRATRTSVSPHLDAAVLRALAKLPADRFASCGDFARALTRAGNSAHATAESFTSPAATTASIPSAPGSSASSAAASAPPRLRVNPLTAAAIVTLVLLVVLGPIAYLRLHEAASLPTFGRSDQLTSDPGLEIQPAISPDGKLVAYSAGNSSRMRIFIRPVSGGRTIALSDDSTAVETQARWSPDGNQLLFLTRGGVSIAPALGGSSRAVVPSSSLAGVAAAAWSPDGKQIAFARNDSIQVLPLAGDAVRFIATAADVHSCSWSPDSRWIACVSGNAVAVTPGASFGNLSPASIVLIAAAGGEPVRTLVARAFNQSPVWSVDGKWLYFLSNRDGPRDIYALRMSAAGRTLAEPVRVTTGLGAMSFSMSADGRQLAYATYAARANIWAVPIPADMVVSAETATPVTTGNQVIESMRVSPDGRWLLYDSDLKGNADVYRLPVSGGTPEQLTNDPADEFAPDLSPDGRAIAYHSLRTGTREIEVKPLDGGPVQQVTHSAEQKRYAVWSPDGKSLAYWQSPPVGIFVAHRGDDGRWTASSTPLAMGVLAEWSHDGSAVAYVAANNLLGRDSLMVIPATGGIARRVFDPGPWGQRLAGQVRWSADDKLLYFKAHDDAGHASFWSVSAAGGLPRLLVRFPNADRQSSRADFAVDRQRLYFAIEDRQSDVFVAQLIGK